MSLYLPITLIGGFLGAGKTAVLQHWLSRHQGPHVAAILMGPTSCSFDANLVRGLLAGCGRSGDWVIDLRDDATDPRWQESLPDAVYDCSHRGSFERLFVEISGRFDVHSVLKVLPAASPGLADHGLRARVDNVATVVDALDIWHRVVRPALAKKAPDSPLAKLLVAQIKSASTIILNKCDLISEDARREISRFLHLINPSALLIQASFGDAPQEALGRPSGARPLADAMARPGIEGAPIETTILPPALARGFLFDKRRPFHPERLWHLCQEGWPHVLRTKGYIWLASRMDLVFSLSQTHAGFSCAVSGHWWASLPEEDWPSDAAGRQRVEKVWREPFGDRRQDLLIIGQHNLIERLVAMLGDCLLTDEEMEAGSEAWRDYPDPFRELTEPREKASSLKHPRNEDLSIDSAVDPPINLTDSS
jgi:G3E family GTPase